VFRLGQLVALRCEVTDGVLDTPVPAETMGIVVGETHRYVQVALEGYGIRGVPSHVLKPYTPPTGDEFIAIIADLLDAKQTLTQQLVRTAAQRPQFGRS
jgi:hypothetical protein